MQALCRFSQNGRLQRDTAFALPTIVICYYTTLDSFCQVCCFFVKVVSKKLPACSANFRFSFQRLDKSCNICYNNDCANRPKCGSDWRCALTHSLAFIITIEVWLSLVVSKLKQLITVLTMRSAQSKEPTEQACRSDRRRLCDGAFSPRGARSS